MVRTHTHTHTLAAIAACICFYCSSFRPIKLNIGQPNIDFVVVQKQLEFCASAEEFHNFSFFVCSLFAVTVVVDMVCNACHGLDHCCACRGFDRWINTHRVTTLTTISRL